MRDNVLTFDDLGRAPRRPWPLRVIVGAPLGALAGVLVALALTCAPLAPRAELAQGQTTQPAPTPAGAAGSVTTCIGEQPAIKAASTAGPSITVNTARTYTIINTGVDSTGAAATGLVCIGINAMPPAADWTEDNNKFPLPAGSSIVVGPQVQLIYLKAAAGAPMVAILPGPEIRP